MLMLRKAGSMNTEYNSQRADNELVKFNSQFEAYAKSDNTFFDVITVSNLAYDVNKRNKWDTQNGVEIEVNITQGSQTGNYTIQIDKDNSQKNFFWKTGPGGAKVYMYELVPEYTVADVKKETDAFGKEIEYIKYDYRFECNGSDVTYNQTTGKVSKMKFKSVENN